VQNSLKNINSDFVNVPVRHLVFLSELPIGSVSVS